MEEIDRVMRDPAASRWLRDALRGALERDPRMAGVIPSTKGSL